jgi:hypothetical protein
MDFGYTMVAREHDGPIGLDQRVSVTSNYRNRVRNGLTSAIYVDDALISRRQHLAWPNVCNTHLS